jgi:hypothetical protein
MKRIAPMALLALLAATALAAPTDVAYLLAEPEFPEDLALATEPLVCLQAALEVQGLEIELATLRALSGDAMAPLLHTGDPVFEPLRERQPLDVLSHACDALGVDGAWHLDLSPEEIVALASEEVGDQRPLIAGFLIRPERHVGWNLIIGAEPASDQIMLWDVGLARHRTVMNPPSAWSGPVPGPAMWAETPIFTACVLEGAGLPHDADQLAVALAAWREQGEVTELALPTHPGALRFTDFEEPPETLTATAGPEAARLLAEEILGLESLDTYSTLWRVRTQMRQLIERRTAGADFLRGLSVDAEVEELAAAMDDVADTARVVSVLMWNDLLLNVERPSDLLARIRLDPSLIVDLSGMPGYQRELLVETIGRWPQPWVMERHSTSWGPILTVDGPELRQRVADRLGELAERMEREIELLRGL